MYWCKEERPLTGCACIGARERTSTALWRSVSYVLYILLNRLRHIDQKWHEQRHVKVLRASNHMSTSSEGSLDVDTNVVLRVECISRLSLKVDKFVAAMPGRIVPFATTHS